MKTKNLTVSELECRIDLGLVENNIHTESALKFIIGEFEAYLRGFLKSQKAKTKEVLKINVTFSDPDVTTL